MCPGNVTLRLHPWDFGIGAEEDSHAPQPSGAARPKKEGSEKKRARRLRRAKFREEERSTVGTQFRASDDSVLLAKVDFGDCV
jgi:hypothetical protein